jgi:hypothetical protein
MQRRREVSKAASAVESWQNSDGTVQSRQTDVHTFATTATQECYRLPGESPGTKSPVVED